jgi:hypothetical protein
MVHIIFMNCYSMIDEEYIPTHFDVLLTDVHSKDLRHEISHRLGVQYLAEHDADDDINEIKGVVWGPHNRIFVPTVIRIGGQKKNVHFLIDTGSPKSYVSQEVFTSFNRMISNPSNPISLHINNKPITVFQSPENSHFEDVNVLGSDYLKTFNAILHIDYGNDSVELCISVP